MNRRLTQRGRERRRQLMDYAALRFAEGGYHPTSVAEIVSGIGVGKGVFYWYFESKEELLVEILRESQLDLRRVQHQAIADEVDPVRRIELGMRASMRWLDTHRHLSTITQFAATEQAFAPTLRERQQVAVDDVVRHVSEAIAQGRIRDQDPVVLAHAILGVTNQLARTFVLERGADPEEVANAAVTFCMEGLLGGSRLATEPKFGHLASVSDAR